MLRRSGARAIKIFTADDSDDKHNALQNQINRFIENHPDLVAIELSMSECETQETLAVIFEKLEEEPKYE